MTRLIQKFAQVLVQKNLLNGCARLAAQTTDAQSINQPRLTGWVANPLLKKKRKERKERGREGEGVLIGERKACLVMLC